MAELMHAFWAYETALMTNDLPTLDALFAPGDATLRGDAGGLLIGHDAISAYRRGRGGAPQRRVLDVHVREIDADHALIIAVIEPRSGGRGQQTQLWQRGADGWQVVAAHVSAPAKPVDPTVWRLVGTPLVEGAASGPLVGQTVAVKDLFAVEGYAIGGGVPGYLSEAEPQAAHAPAVAALLDAGASITGIARTDEFAFSIAGRNPHYGTPPNPAVVGGIPGGSSNGPASAVGLGQVTIGLGTDTGGSVRVPASYQGLWGIRTTHGAVDRAGLLPLAPSFDTVGWLTRDAATLRAAAAVSLPDAADVAIGGYVVCDALTALAGADVRESFAAVVAPLAPESVELPGLDALFEGFRTVQAAEAWRVHGGWITAHPGAVGDDIAARFAWASGFTAADEASARAALAEAREQMDQALAGRVLLLPTASSAAPQTTATPEENEATRAGTLRLTCVAGILGAPAVSAPLLRVAAGPVGLCFVGPRGSDLALIELAASVASSARPSRS